MLAVCAVAAIVLYRAPYSASGLEPAPDAVEYALAGHRLAFQGHYTITVGGRDLPPRYSPWFSLLVTAPAYRLFGAEPGNAIIPVTILAVIGVLIAYRIGYRIGSEWGALLASLGILAIPEYRNLGRLVMTDVPAVVLLLGACLLYVRIRASEKRPERDLALAGVLIAIAASFRPVSAAAVLPFLPAVVRPFRPLSLIRRAAALFGPLAVVGAATLFYDASAFGSPGRNGYQFWCAIPYDYAGLTFSKYYLRRNLETLWRAWLPLLAVAGVALWAVERSRRTARGETTRSASTQLLWFLLIGTGPIMVFHLYYFFPRLRFFLPSLVFAVVLVGSCAGALFARMPRAALAVVAMLALAGALVFRIAAPDPTPDRRVTADLIRQTTPPSAWVISGLAPAYLEYLVAGDSGRRIIPISRRVEYANKVIVRKKIDRPVPLPQGWWDHRGAGLLAGGAEEAVPYVASERLDELGDEVRKGRPVFVDTSALRPRDEAILQEIARRFQMIPRGHQLFELAPRV